MKVNLQVGQTYEHYSKFHDQYVYFQITQVHPDKIFYDYSPKHPYPDDVPLTGLNVTPRIFYQWVRDGQLVLDNSHPFEIET
jgi:hypothetical protein